MSRILKSPMVATCCLLTAVGLLFSQDAENNNNDDASRAKSQPLLMEQEFGSDLNFGATQIGDPVEVTARYRVEADSREGRLFVEARIDPQWHVYSLTQPRGGPTPTKIEVTPSDDFEILGEFDPDSDPHVTPDHPQFPGVTVEEHKLGVTWSAPIKVADGIDPDQLQISVKVSGLTCVSAESGAGQCRPFSAKLTATFDNSSQVSAEKFAPKGSHVLWHGTVSPAAVEPGKKLTVNLTAEPQGDYHIYAYAPSQPDDAMSNSTLVAFTKTNGWSVSEPTPSSVAVKKDLDDQEVAFHHTPITWTFEVEVPRSAEAKTYSLGGIIGFQTCTEKTCDKPGAVKFTAQVPVGSSTDTGNSTSTVPISFTQSGKYVEVVALRAEQVASTVRDAGAWKGYSIAVVLPLAFLAGLILNVMPCVLPVIGLKIMSFVQQAGENPGRVFMLNMIFVAGMLLVFMLLATLAVFSGYGWGELYKDLGFKVVMISVIFVFGLSFFGVWEIPIPGFVGTGSGSKLAEQEGATGAFFKGILTTLLATPCSGPLLIPAVVWAIAQPAWLTYMVFLALGLGMAAPYLIIGAMPRLASFLPKPGNWMVTFKQLMGFVLMGTVVFFMGSVGEKYTLPVLSLLVFLGVACWWVGRTSLAAELPQQVKAWATAGVITAIGIYFSFVFLLPQHELPWERYSKVTLNNHLADGKTVFVDFTADW